MLIGHRSLPVAKITLDQVCVTYEKAFAVKTFTYFGKVKLSFSNIHLVSWLNCLNSAIILHYNLRITVRCYWIFTLYACYTMKNIDFLLFFLFCLFFESKIQR